MSGATCVRVRDELDRVVGQVLGEVVALLGRARRLDRVVVVDEVGVALVGLAAEEAVEALEAAARAASGRRAGRGVICSAGVRCHLPTANVV